MIIKQSLIKYKTQPNDQGEKMVEINLAKQRGQPQPILFSANLLAELRQVLLILFQDSKTSLRDIFSEAKTGSLISHA